MAEQVFPTKGNLINTKKSLSLAKLGYELMDRKTQYSDSGNDDID